MQGEWKCEWSCEMSRRCTDSVVSGKRSLKIFIGVALRDEWVTHVNGIFSGSSPVSRKSIDVCLGIIDVLQCHVSGKR